MIGNLLKNLSRCREISRIILSPIYCFYFYLFQFPWNFNWRIYGFPIIYKYRGSNIKIGERLTLRSNRRSNIIGVSQPVVLRTNFSASEIIIGSDVGISGSSIVSSKRISIGNNVLIGSGALIIDTDMHPINPEWRLLSPDSAESKEIIIHNNVFIGARAIILKGVEIGEGAVIGAGSVVTKNVLPYTLVAGNPASVVKVLRQ